MGQIPKVKWSLHIVAGEDGAALQSDGGPLEFLFQSPAPTLSVTGCHPLKGAEPDAGTNPAMGAIAGLSGDQLVDSQSPRVPSVQVALESAEGYLELITGAATTLGVNGRIRRTYALKCLRLALLCEGRTEGDSQEARRQMVIGQSLRMLRRHRAAANAFCRAARYRSFRVEALMALGWCQKRLGQLDQSIASLTRALSIAPEDARLHFNLACYLCLAGQHRAALYELAWAIELCPPLRNRATIEPDFDALRTTPAFDALTSVRNSAR